MGIDSFTSVYIRQKWLLFLMPPSSKGIINQMRLYLNLIIWTVKLVRIHFNLWVSLAWLVTSLVLLALLDFIWLLLYSAMSMVLGSGHSVGEERRWRWTNVVLVYFSYFLNFTDVWFRAFNLCILKCNVWSLFVVDGVLSTNLIQVNRKIFRTSSLLFRW